MRVGKRESAEQARRVELDELLIEKLDSLARPLIETRANEELQMALKRIPEDYALVLKLKFLDEMPLKRIAGFLGLPVSTIKWRVHRGKELLRKELEQQKVLQ